MRKYILLFSLFFVSQLIIAQHKYFRPNGKEVDMTSLVKEAAEKELVMFGEFHNDSLCHMLKAEFLEALMELKNGAVIIGAEMFETPSQDHIDAFLKGKISYDSLVTSIPLWKNFGDYGFMLQLADNYSSPFIATNAPKVFSQMVYAKGLGVLDELEKKHKKFFADLPVVIDTSLLSYKQILNLDIGHKVEFLVDAQAFKDATMAKSIISNLKKKNTFFHLHGAYHALYGEGILHYIKLKKKKLRFMNIITVHQDQLDFLDDKYKKHGTVILAILKKD